MVRVANIKIVWDRGKSSTNKIWAVCGRWFRGRWRDKIEKESESSLDIVVFVHSKIDLSVIGIDGFFPILIVQASFAIVVVVASMSRRDIDTVRVSLIE
jgi:hypothetical protein